jgi:hypothetical protein
MNWRSTTVISRPRAAVVALNEMWSAVGRLTLPGAGYEALHPELKDVNPEDYPDIHKMAILADVAPYSREYNTYRSKYPLLSF